MEGLALFNPGRSYLAGTDAVLKDLKAFPQRFQNLQSYMLAGSVGWLPAFVFPSQLRSPDHPTKNKFCLLCNSIWPLRVTITEQVHC
jgi:hypothetical protein